MNTAEFAKKLGVSTKTVRKWIKQLDIPCAKNEYGHYVFDNHDLPYFKGILEQLRSGTKTGEITIKELQRRKGTVRKMVEVKEHSAAGQSIENMLAAMMERIKFNERKIEEKASDVVSYQLLQHRKEIDELQQRVKHLEDYIQKLETEKEQSIKKEPPIVLDQVQSPRRRKKIIGFLI